MLGLIMTLSLSPLALTTTVTPEEMNEALTWVAAKFEGKQIVPPQEAALIVLANNDPVQKNARGGRPMKIVDKEYRRGLYCHAVSKVVVRLPGPGKTFAAIIGVDTNDQTSGGRGSVVFSVNVGGKEAFRSGLMREGMPGAPVSVDLGGATEFVLEIGDGGDGIGCDQSDWADAKVTLADGRELWLGDLPIVAGQRKAPTTALPFSFVYGGKPFSELCKDWKLTRAAERLDDKRTGHTLTYVDPKTGLEVRCRGVQYQDFPTVEWTLYFKNTGEKDTPIIEKILPLDIEVERTGAAEFLLHHFIGSPANGSDYGPLETTLGAGTSKRIGAAGGRPTNSDMSYFNLAWGEEGMIVVVGWPGQWSAEFARDKGVGLAIRAGQELTHFTLHPGEEVRSPMMVLQFYRGDWIRAQNVWRRWMMAHSMPRPGGKLPQPQFLASSSRAYEEMIGANEQNQIMHIDRYLEEGLKLDYWWMDAGWYVNKTGWPNVGTWEVDPKRFPRGLRPISDHAHAKGVKILVWFEPERVTAGTWIAEKHPEWVLGGAKGGLLNLGNPEAWTWLVNHVDKLLTEQGIDLYRQDFNMDPLGYWRGNDAPDRQGITEIKHVTGYLAYWDELRRRHPNMLIDSCASGGRRNDLETMRRAVPMWRSDYAFEPVGHQCMTYGLSFWIPFHGTGTVATVNAGYYGGGFTPVEAYAFWSNAAPSLGSGIDVRVKEIDYAALRRLLGEWRATAKYYYGDFYPLMPWTRDKDVWMAWQFNAPESGEGMVQVFRRSDSAYEAARFRLHGLEPEATYVVGNVDTPDATREMGGKELMEKGVRVDIGDRPGVAVLRYRRK
ncbi:MAG: alpha-galactosidase [Phycisphaerae bacterium]|nr:alpha-galactosidase [Phycisphaerae bacterium]